MSLDSRFFGNYRFFDILNKIEYNTIKIYSKDCLMKTLTMRVDDSIYEMIKLAAEGQKRNISNFIEFATLQYLSSSQYVDSVEMNEIMSDVELVNNLRNGFNDLKNGDYVIV